MTAMSWIVLYPAFFTRGRTSSANARYVFTCEWGGARALEA